MGTVNKKKQYQVSFQSNLRRNTATEPEDLEIFCAIVSSAGRFELLEEKVAQFKGPSYYGNKRQQKMREKEAQAT